MIWILSGIYGLFYGLTEGGERALVADLVQPHLRGTAYGLYNFSLGISTLPASFLYGGYSIFYENDLSCPPGDEGYTRFLPMISDSSLERFPQNDNFPLCL
jgi:MFS family permease